MAKKFLNQLDWNRQMPYHDWKAFSYLAQQNLLPFLLQYSTTLLYCILLTIIDSSKQNQQLGLILICSGTSSIISTVQTRKSQWMSHSAKGHTNGRLLSNFIGGLDTGPKTSWTVQKCYKTSMGYLSQIITVSTKPVLAAQFWVWSKQD